MNKVTGIALLIAGVVLLVFGFNALDSVNSHVSNMFNGAPSNKSIMLLVSGSILAICGALSVFRTSERG